MWRLFLTVSSLAAVSFGGGQILMTGLEREFVQTGLIGKQEFAGAIALGQATPGPLASFTTAVGMSVGGIQGAIAATLGLLVVSLIAVAIISRVPSRLFSHPKIKAAFRSIGPLAAAMAFFLGVHIAKNSESFTIRGKACGIAIGLLVLLGRLYKLPTLLLMLGAMGVALIPGVFQ